MTFTVLQDTAEIAASALAAAMSGRFSAVLLANPAMGDRVAVLHARIAIS